MVVAMQRWSGVAALAVAIVALIAALQDPSSAAESHAAAAKAKVVTRTLLARNKRTVIASTQRKANGVLLLGRNKRFPAAAIPTVTLAKNASRLGGVPAKSYKDSCRSDTIDFGTWCLQSATFAPDQNQVGKSDYAFATQTCLEQGGWLPSAGELMAAAARAKLKSTLDDSRLSASIDEDPSDGRKDSAEMSSTLVTTTSGGTAAGSPGVTPGAKGDPRQGEPDPVPIPADPMPDTLQYVMVYDNHDHGGFGGAQPVSKPASFRCAFAKAQGADAGEVG